MDFRYPSKREKKGSLPACRASSCITVFFELAIYNSDVRLIINFCWYQFGINIKSILAFNRFSTGPPGSFSSWLLNFFPLPHQKAKICDKQVTSRRWLWPAIQDPEAIGLPDRQRGSRDLWKLPHSETRIWERDTWSSTWRGSCQCGPGSGGRPLQLFVKQHCQINKGSSRDDKDMKRLGDGRSYQSMTTRNNPGASALWVTLTVDQISFRSVNLYADWGFVKHSTLHVTNGANLFRIPPRVTSPLITFGCRENFKLCFWQWLNENHTLSNYHHPSGIDFQCQIVFGSFTVVTWWQLHTLVSVTRCFVKAIFKLARVISANPSNPPPKFSMEHTVWQGTPPKRRSTGMFFFVDPILDAECSGYWQSLWKAHLSEENLWFYGIVWGI